MKKQTSALNLLEQVYTGAYIQRPVRFLRGPHRPSIILPRHRIQPIYPPPASFPPLGASPKTGASPSTHPLDMHMPSYSCLAVLPVAPA